MLATLAKAVLVLVWHYDNTYKDFTYNDFSYNINKCNITYVFLFSVTSPISYR